MLDLTFIIDFLWATFDTVSQVFTLVFYLTLISVAIYALAAVVYNLVLIHRRKAAERWEPPVAHITGKVYPDGKEMEGK